MPESFNPVGANSLWDAIYYIGWHAKFERSAEALRYWELINNASKIFGAVFLVVAIIYLIKHHFLPWYKNEEAPLTPKTYIITFLAVFMVAACWTNLPYLIITFLLGWMR